MRIAKFEISQELLLLLKNNQSVAYKIKTNKNMI